MSFAQRISHIPHTWPAPPKKTEAAGVYRRGDWFWLRYTVNGEEIRLPLRTQLYEEAVTKAKELRGQVPEAAAKVKGGWSAIIEKYLREKQNPKRPSGYTGKDAEMGRSYDLFCFRPAKNLDPNPLVRLNCRKLCERSSNRRNYCALTGWEAKFLMFRRLESQHKI